MNTSRYSYSAMSSRGDKFSPPKMKFRKTTSVKKTFTFRDLENYMKNKERSRKNS